MAKKTLKKKLKLRENVNTLQIVPGGPVINLRELSDGELQKLAKDRPYLFENIDVIEDDQADQEHSGK